MSIQTQEYARKPLLVQAVQVTEENMADVAEWCGGEVRTAPEKADSPAGNYIHVKVFRALDQRLTKAFVNDWVLFANNGYKVFTPKAFSAGFDLVQADEN